VNSTRGNADYTISEPVHYPFAFSENPVLQYINQQLVKAKPSFHKKTFLKPDIHRSAEFCSTCHKVHLPFALNNYKEFLRGQNHYDPYLLSGVSGHGARSFYYPPKAVHNCAGCHMPLQESGDFGAREFDESGELKIHDHLFPSANTAIAHLRGEQDIVLAHQKFLKDIIRIDVFGLRKGGEIDGELIAPLRPEVPTLKPGEKYLLETVIRTLKMGHLFTQGTADSNEVWMDVTVRSGDRVIGRSGGIDETSTVDPWSHFVNVYMLDKDGNRINRRNPQDIFTPLYNHQIPPGAADVVHYGLELPDDVNAPVTVTVKLQYRKFDQEYMDFVTRSAKPGDVPIRGYTPGEPYRNDLPITTLAEDSVTFPVEGATEEPPAPEDRGIKPWERWNDYGIGLLLLGPEVTKVELKQAEEAFKKVEEFDVYHGPLNLARVYFAEGRLEEAVEALGRAAKYEDDAAAPRWTVAWLSGLVNREQGYLDKAEINFRSVLEDSTEAMQQRGFDFSLDYEVINLLGQTLFDLAKQRSGDEQRELYQQAVAQFQKTLDLDPENVRAHHNLHQLYSALGEKESADEHLELHSKYKPDDNARGQAINEARKKSAAANHAAEPLVIYPLHRDGAPGLATTEQASDQDSSLETSE
jgi:tetratricopeptide (TPR) repeat protein